MDQELIEFAYNLLELVGDDGVFTFEGETYRMEPDFREKLREMTNAELERSYNE